MTFLLWIARPWAVVRMPPPARSILSARVAFVLAIVRSSVGYAAHLPQRAPRVQCRFAAMTRSVWVGSVKHAWLPVRHAITQRLHVRLVSRARAPLELPKRANRPLSIRPMLVVEPIRGVTSPRACGARVRLTFARTSVTWAPDNLAVRRRTGCTLSAKREIATRTPVLPRPRTWALVWPMREMGKRVTRRWAPRVLCPHVVLRKMAVQAVLVSYPTVQLAVRRGPLSSRDIDCACSPQGLRRLSLEAHDDPRVRYNPIQDFRL